MGRAYLVMWTMQCFKLYTHWSLQHSKASCYFQTGAELHLSVHDLCPSKPHPFAQTETDVIAHGRILHSLHEGIPSKMEALSVTTVYNMNYDHYKLTTHSGSVVNVVPAVSDRVCSSRLTKRALAQS